MQNKPDYLPEVHWVSGPQPLRTVHPDRQPADGDEEVL